MTAEIRDAVVAHLLYLEEQANEKDNIDYELALPTTKRSLTQPNNIKALEDNVTINNTVFSAYKSSDFVQDNKNIPSTAKPVDTPSEQEDTLKPVVKAEAPSKISIKTETTKASENTTRTTQVSPDSKPESEPKPKPNAKTIAKEPTKPAKPAKPAIEGWIYIGRFDENREHWETPILNVKTTLPEIEQQYTIQVTSVNIRDALPKKDTSGQLKLGQLVKTILRKQALKVLQLKRSGRSDHYWARIMLK